MFKTICLGHPFGIGTYVHWTFWFLLLFVAFANLWMGIAAVLSSIVFVCAVFGCVVLHELGHALMARRFGIRTLDIYLYPIGGAARLERIPENPWQEFLIAIAGPSVNGVIVLVLFALLGFGHAAFGNVSHGLAAFAYGGLETQLAMLLLANLVLGVFNLLPAFPMDGGRILRAALATSRGYLEATEKAAKVGKYMAALFAIIGLFTFHFTLILLAGFIYIAGQQELWMVRLRHATFVSAGPYNDVIIDVTPSD